MATRIKAKRFGVTVLLLCVLATQTRAATITVTNTNDSGPGSLRQALAIANDGDTITFAVTGTISLTSGGLLIAKNVTISGPGANQLSVDGNHTASQCVFAIVSGKTVTISGLTITNGDAGICNGGTLTVSNCVVTGNQSYGGLQNGGGNDYLTIANSTVSDNFGPGVYNFSYRPLPTPGTTALNERSRRMPAEERNDGGNCDGCMTIADSIVSGNSGPGVSNVSNPAIAMILNSTLTGNSAGPDWGGGGGIDTTATFKAAPAQVTVGNSTISGNSASYGGGISSVRSDLTIVNSTISGNSVADSGGGIFHASSFTPVTIVNSTISGNSAEVGGGGIFNGYAGHVEIANSTCSGNSAASGGGIYNYQESGASTVLEISNTILNAGASGENIFNNAGTVTSHGYNISSDNGGGYLNGPGDQINTDPLLGPLQDNGGPTLTHAPLPGSPAIDAGDPNFSPPPFRDQRGACYRRVYGRRLDVGSVELQPPRCPPTPAPRPTPH